MLISRMNRVLLLVLLSTSKARRINGHGYDGIVKSCQDFIDLQLGTSNPLVSNLSGLGSCMN